MYRDTDGLHVHSRKLSIDHAIITIEPRILYRAVCKYGKVFESGREVIVKQKIESHVANLNHW